MTGVPLLSAGVVIGVLHVGRVENAVFARHELELLLVTAERAAGAIQGRSLKTEVAAAELLERACSRAHCPPWQVSRWLAGMSLPQAGRSAGTGRTPSPHRRASSGWSPATSPDTVLTLR